MTQLIPNITLFDLEFPLTFRKRMPTIDGTLSGWTDGELLPHLGALDARDQFAPVWACWNETGLAIAARVEKKKSPLRCDPASFWAGDNLRLCLDMRDARANKRATRYCQQFFFLPTGSGRGQKKAVAGTTKFKRARADAPTIPSERIQVASKVHRNGYAIEAFIPADCLSGFDPSEHSRIGFYYILEDADHGQQYMTVGDDLYWYVDPSTWATAVLYQPAPPRKRPAKA